MIPVSYRYIGFIAGLGVRERDWGKSRRLKGAPKKIIPYYTDHDIEGILDFEMDNEDVYTLNEVSKVQDRGY